MSDQRKRKISASRFLLQNPYAYLDGDGDFDAVDVSLKPSIEQPSQHEYSADRIRLENPYAHLDELRFNSALTQKRKNANFNKRFDPPHGSPAEQKAYELLVEIWKNRSNLWPEGVPQDPIDMIDLSVAAMAIGYELENSEYLGDYTAREKVAGVIDRVAKRIRVSNQYPPAVRRFTVAHELGHALMHDGMTMHRDHPLDGSFVSRDTVEREADKFATYLLMPEKLVFRYFEEVFGLVPFVLDDATAFALSPSSPHRLLENNDPRVLSRILATTERFNGHRFVSLADRFGVSAETMAIRIEELGLVRMA